MDARLAEIKIEALLHDPPGKAPTLWYRRHEDFSARLVEAVLGRPPQHADLVKDADRYAAAVDRWGLPRDPVDYRVDFLRQPEIVHPLSGVGHTLRPLTADMDPGLVEDEQRGAVEDLVRRAGGPGVEPERLYWTLWRGLEDALGARGDIGNLWRHLPADTRMPDHSIWDHMRLAAAFAGALPEPALLLFSLGPVQSLIEAARKTGDLWAGSFLLSWLIWRSMRGVVSAHGADAVLFPDLRRQPLVDEWLRGRGWAGIGELSRPSQVASLPNRFLALVPAADAAGLAAECEQALAEGLEEFASGCFAGLVRRHGGRQDAVRKAIDQAVGSLTCQWHVLPWQPEGGLEERSTVALGDGIAHFWQAHRMLAGATVYRPNAGSYFAVQSALIEAAHGAAKAMRRFDQIDEAGDRCTVCGVREWLWQAPAPGVVGRGSRARPSERLCGLCGSRREAPLAEWARQTTGDAVLFPSTHNLAASRFFEGVLATLARATSGADSERDLAVARALPLFLEAVPAEFHYATRALMRRARECGGYQRHAERLVKLPAELLEPATYNDPEALAEHGLEPAGAQAARGALSAFLAACSDAGIPAPGRYYAVLVMDGDHMGRWLSGRMSPTIAEVLHPGALPADDAQRRLLVNTMRPLSASHQVAISRALNEFSLEIVEPVIEDVHGGVVVYAGGDDVLAMLPLHAALPALRDLRRLYSGMPLHDTSEAAGWGFESRDGWVKKGPKLWRVMGERATCSMGVAVAHAKSQLRHALETAREMERLAKNGLDRNAVVVASLKRSGGHERFGARWGTGDGLRSPDALAPVQEVTALIESELLSRRFAYALREEARVLWGLGPAVRERAYWLLERHWRKARGPFDAPRARALANDLQALADSLGGDPLGGPAVAAMDQPASRFVGALGLADLIARGGRDSE